MFFNVYIYIHYQNIYQTSDNRDNMESSIIATIGRVTKPKDITAFKNIERRVLKSETYVFQIGQVITITENIKSDIFIDYPSYIDHTMKSLIKTINASTEIIKNYKGNSTEYFNGVYVYLFYIFAKNSKLQLPSSTLPSSTVKKYNNLFKSINRMTGISTTDSTYVNLIYKNEIKIDTTTIKYVPFSEITDKQKLREITSTTNPATFNKSLKTASVRSIRTSPTLFKKHGSSHGDMSDFGDMPTSVISQGEEPVYTDFDEIMDYFDKNTGCVVNYISLKDMIIDNYSHNRIYVAYVLYKLYSNPTLLDILNSSHGTLTNEINIKFAKKSRYIQRDINDPTLKGVIAYTQEQEGVIASPKGKEDDDDTQKPKGKEDDDEEQTATKEPSPGPEVRGI